MDFDAWVQNNRALWARVYDEVIMPDVEKEWKNRTKSDDDESKKKYDALQVLKDHISNEVVEKAKLVEENARLRSLVLKSRGTTPSADELAANTSDATVSIAKYQEIAEQLDELNTRYRTTAQRIKYLERKNVAVMQKNKEMKDSVKLWQEYCDRHMEKRKAKAESKALKLQPRASVANETPAPLPNIPSSPGTAALRTPLSLMPQDRSSPDHMADLSHVTAQPPLRTADLVNEETEDIQAQLDPNNHERYDDSRERDERSSPLPPSVVECAPAGSRGKNDRATFLGHPSSDKITSSQTTVPEASEQDNERTPRANAPVEDDEAPVFVSERSLKRKRKLSTGFKVFQDGSSDGTPARPVRVKEEVYSSPPPGPSAQQLVRMETMDLDELGPNPIMTPRRQRLRRMDSTHSNQTGTVQNQRSSSAPLGGTTVKPEFTKEVYMPEDRLGARLAMTPKDVRAFSEPQHNTMEDREHVLQPIDPNVVAGSANKTTPDKGIGRVDAREQDQFDILAESGEEPPPSTKKRKRLPPNLARAHFNERIRAAKSGLSPLKPALTTPRTAPARPTAAHAPTPPSALTRPAYTPSARPAQRRALEAASRADPVPEDRPIWRMGALSPVRKTAKSATPKPSAPQTRLRDKPVTELRIHDFKPNPAFNGGYTHAFTDTVRRREDRLCLPGCTKPDCCGSTFRALALALPALSTAQEETLLQEYLGDAYDSFGLTQMDGAERAEIVLQARTRQMATEHGKHRRVYEGRRTPPGFWRVDFPTTQEAEEDREQAVQMQMAEVRERYLQAMRRGGRFMFADE